MTRREFFKLAIAGCIGIALGGLRATRLSKIELVKRLMANAIETHDRLIEEAIFKS